MTPEYVPPTRKELSDAILSLATTGDGSSATFDEVERVIGCVLERKGGLLPVDGAPSTQIPPLVMAVDKKQLACLEYLVKWVGSASDESVDSRVQLVGHPLEAVTESAGGNTSPHFAAHHGWTEGLIVLTEYLAFLERCYRGGSRTETDALLELLSARNINGDTPIMMACTDDANIGFVQCCIQRLSALQSTINTEALFAMTNNDENTALSIAYTAGNYKMVSCLLGEDLEGDAAPRCLVSISREDIHQLQSSVKDHEGVLRTSTSLTDIQRNTLGLLTENLERCLQLLLMKMEEKVQASVQELLLLEEQEEKKVDAHSADTASRRQQRAPTKKPKGKKKKKRMPKTSDQRNNERVSLASGDEPQFSHSLEQPKTNEEEDKQNDRDNGEESTSDGETEFLPFARTDRSTLAQTLGAALNEYDKFHQVETPSSGAISRSRPLSNSRSRHAEGDIGAPEKEPRSPSERPAHSGQHAVQTSSSPQLTKSFDGDKSNQLSSGRSYDGEGANASGVPEELSVGTETDLAPMTGKHVTDRKLNQMMRERLLYTSRPPSSSTLRPQAQPWQPHHVGHIAPKAEIHTPTRLHFVAPFFRAGQHRTSDTTEKPDAYDCYDTAPTQNGSGNIQAEESNHEVFKNIAYDDYSTVCDPEQSTAVSGDALMDTLCLEPSMVLMSSRAMAVTMSPSQLDAIEELLQHQLLAVKEARVMQTQLMLNSTTMAPAGGEGRRFGE